MPYDPARIFSHGYTDPSADKKEVPAFEKSIRDRTKLSLVMADDDEDDRDLFKEALEKTGRDIQMRPMTTTFSPSLILQFRPLRVAT